MSVANLPDERQSLLGNTDLDGRPFAREVAEARPELWRKYVETCERERHELTPGLEESRAFQLAEAIDDAARQRQFRELEIADGAEEYRQRREGAEGRAAA
ncbi:MAG: hypothetical protein ABW208_07245 [Pyrinomonadaceae bacterium]